MVKRQRGGSTASDLVTNLVKTINSPLAYNAVGGVSEPFSPQGINQPVSSFNYAQVAPMVQTGGKRRKHIRKKSNRKKKTKSRKMKRSRKRSSSRLKSRRH